MYSNGNVRKSYGYAFEMSEKTLNAGLISLMDFRNTWFSLYENINYFESFLISTYQVFDFEVTLLEEKICAHCFTIHISQNHLSINGIRQLFGKLNCSSRTFR